MSSSLLPAGAPAAGAALTGHWLTATKSWGANFHHWEKSQLSSRSKFILPESFVPPFFNLWRTFVIHNNSMALWVLDLNALHKKWEISHFQGTEKKWLKDTQWLFQVNNPGVLSYNQNPFAVLFVNTFQEMICGLEHKNFCSYEREKGQRIFNVLYRHNPLLKNIRLFQSIFYSWTDNYI